MAVWAHSGLAQQTILVSAADMASVSSLSRLDRTISSVVMVCSGWNASHPNDVMCVLGILSILRLKNKTTLLSLFFSALSLLVHLFLVTFSLSGFLFFSPEFVLRINCLEENGLERCFFLSFSWNSVWCSFWSLRVFEAALHQPLHLASTACLSLCIPVRKTKV